MSTKDAAREALASHDALTLASRREPPEDYPAAWLAWHDAEYRPAYARWDAAMTALATATDDPTMSRHPFNFRPRCARLLAS